MIIETPKAIETIYPWPGGDKFRSRLEARWAVFLTTLGVPYIYEKEGYDLGDVGWYLPDFWLPELKTWLEIKGDAATPLELAKAEALANETGYPVIVSSGHPGYTAKQEELGYYHEESLYTLMCIWGYNPVVKNYPVCSADVSYWFESYFGDKEYSLPWFLRQHYPANIVPNYDGTPASIGDLIDLDCQYFMTTYGKKHPKWEYGISNNDLSWGWADRGLQVVDNDHSYRRTIDSRIKHALTVARQARFEHGERGT